MLDKRQVQRQFDRSASHYDRVAAMQREIVEQLLLASAPFKGGSILDAGCGTGYGLKRLSERSSDFMLKGIDLAPKMLEQARLACPEAEFVVADLECLPLLDESQDVVLSSSAIQWCDSRSAITEFERCLVSGGQLLLSTFTQGTLSDWRALWGRNNRQRFLSANGLAGLFDSGAWSDVRLWQQEYLQSFSSFSSAVASVRDLGAGDASPQRSAKPMTRSQLNLVKDRVNRIIEQQGFIDLKYQVAFVVAAKSQV